MDCGFQQFGTGLHEVDVVQLEVEVLRLGDLQILHIVGQRGGSGDVGILGVVGNGDRADAADVDHVASFFDFALIVAVAVRNGNVLGVQRVHHGRAPNFGNKAGNRHFVKSFLFLKNFVFGLPSMPFLHREQNVVVVFADFRAAHVFDLIIGEVAGGFLADFPRGT